MALSSGFLSLEQFAAARCGEVQGARGHCLDATVQLGREALRLGVAQRVAFVRWDVRDDPEFLEHWALALEDGRVIDMTAVQVDGDPRPLRRLDEYPPNYERPRRYPVDGLVPEFDRHGTQSGSRYSRRQIWSVHLWLFRHDAAAALRCRSLGEFVGAARALARAAAVLATDAALERAVGRLSRLRARLGP